MAGLEGNGNGNGRRAFYGVNIARGQSLDALHPAPGPEPAASPARAHRFSLAEHPEFLLTYSSEFPDKIKVRKRITAWPLQFKLKADYSRRQRAFQYSFSCKDSLLKGSLSVNLQEQLVEYRKLLPMGSGTGLAISAQCNLPGLASFGHNAPLHPTLSVQWHMGSGAASWARDKLDLRKKFRLGKALGIEACGTAEFPQPQARYALRGDESQFSMGEGSFHLHLDQLNLVLDL